MTQVEITTKGFHLVEYEMGLTTKRTQKWKGQSAKVIYASTHIYVQTKQNPQFWLYYILLLNIASSWI